MYIRNFIGDPTDNLRNIYESSIAEHLINNRDSAEFGVDFFSVSNKPHTSFPLKVLETIHILSTRPSLCKQKECLLELNFNSV